MAVKQHRGGSSAVDDPKHQIKDAFARNPRALVEALGLRVDERKSKGASLWVYDGAEDEASLQIGGKPGMEGLCTRYGDDWHGDVFGLCQRVRPTETFRSRLEFCARIYGISLDQGRSSDGGGHRDTVVKETSYAVQIDGQVVAVHRRQDLQGGAKRVWWCGPDGGKGVPQGVRLTELPLMSFLMVRSN